MARTTDHRFVLVTRHTRLEELVARFNTQSQARFYVEHLGADFADYEREHETYLAAVQVAREILSGHGRLHVLDRSFLPNYVFAPDDHVAAIGQDGLVANTLKYIGKRPLVGINPDPARWDGVLVPTQVGELERVLGAWLDGSASIRAITFARAVLNTGQSLLAVNDLFIGARTHISARYQITSGAKSESQSSSGIIVSTGLGSTGWLKSIRHGAAVIAGQPDRPGPLSWDTKQLVFSVREPFPSRSTQAGIVSGHASGKLPLVVTSAMAEHGVIFSDGMESDFLSFNSGVTATITPLPEAGWLVVKNPPKLPPALPKQRKNARDS